LAKSIATLQRDLEHVLNTGEGYTQEIAEWVGNDIAKSLERQLSGITKQRKGTLRLSNLGTPCERKLWYHVNSEHEPEPLPPSARNKFIFGDLTESHVLGLVKASGHTLEGLQTPVDVFGIRGHRDCVIDGMLFDVKSCSSRAFDKFKYGKLREDDSFGYISQLSSYLYGSRDDPIVTKKNKAGFLAVDKQFGHIAVDIYDLTEDLERKEEEVLRKQHVVNEVEPPERAYEPVPHNKSGNMKLPVACSYCDYNRTCWPEARKFLYSNGPVFLTKVEREPTGNVFEDKDW
jgi:hypothetical protein